MLLYSDHVSRPPCKHAVQSSSQLEAFFPVLSQGSGSVQIAQMGLNTRGDGGSRRRFKSGKITRTRIRLR